MQIVLPGIKGIGELWLDVVRTICGDLPNKEDSSMCDLMCHRMPYTPALGFKERTYVDIQDRGFDYPEERHNFIQMDILEFLSSCGVDYDLMICSDGVEHLTAEEGQRMINYMEAHSTMQVIFTPLGEYMISEDDNPDSHKSGWIPEMLPNYLSIVFPDFHPALGIGAFFAVNCSDEEKQRISNEIKSKYVKDSAY